MTRKGRHFADNYGGLDLATWTYGLYKIPERQELKLLSTEISTNRIHLDELVAFALHRNLNSKLGHCFYSEPLSTYYRATSLRLLPIRLWKNCATSQSPEMSKEFTARSKRKRACCPVALPYKRVIPVKFIILQPVLKSQGPSIRHLRLDSEEW